MAVFLAFVVEATAGFGATLVTVTIAAQFYEVDEVLAIFVPVNILLSATLVARNAALVDRSLLLRRVLPWMGLGFVLGLAAFRLHGEGWIKGVFGVFVVVLSVIELRRGTAPAAPIPPRIRAAALVGAGLIHGLFACGGPLLVWVLGREIEDKGRFRATLSTVWLVLGLVLVGGYTASGTLTVTTLGTSALLLGPLAAGLLVGDRLHRWVDPVRFRRGVYALLLLAGLSLAVRSL